MTEVKFLRFGANSKGGKKMSEELAYSIHLGSDKNKTAKAKEKAKTNLSGETSLANNGIQNAQQLSKVNKHNLRDYDNNKDLIKVVYGTYDLTYDVQQLYLQEFEQARIEYNNKQTRKDRKIDSYFKHISNSKLWDLTCEFIIELGDMDFWQNKDIGYRTRMIEVYNEQVQDLIKIVPEFKIANAVIHFDETSPHLHIVGVPVTENNKRGMKKQVAKSKIFTKESLTKIQDEMRNCCIKSYNRVYEKNAILKQKQLGRNQDINVNDMLNYREIKKQKEKNTNRISGVTNKANNLDIATEKVNNILEELKPSKLNRNNMLISNEDVQEMKKLTEEITDITEAVKSVNDLNLAIKDFEHYAFETRQEVSSLKYQLEQKDDVIDELKKELSTKEKIIGKLQTEKEKLKQELQKFKDFWHNIMSHFHKRICYDKDENYKIVSDDLYKNGIFDNNDNEITNNIYRKVTIPNENKMKDKKKNDYNLN